MFFVASNPIALFVHSLRCEDNIPVEKKSLLNTVHHLSLKLYSILNHLYKLDLFLLCLLNFFFYFIVFYFLKKNKENKL